MKPLEGNVCHLISQRHECGPICLPHRPDLIPVKFSLRLLENDTLREKAELRTLIVKLHRSVSEDICSKQFCCCNGI
jgi:hypothetical protein